MKSLRWLRGWVSEKAVQDEFDKLKRHQEFSSSCPSCQKAEKKCLHPPPNLIERFKELARKRTLKPAIILLICCFASQFAGMNQMSPFIVQILEAFNSSLDPKKCTIYLSSTAIVGAIFWGLIIKFVGKRKILLTSLAGCCICLHLLGIYGYLVLPSGIKALDQNRIQQNVTEASLIPILVFAILKFLTTGIIGIPFIMFSELFPFKTRILASSCTQAISFIFVFISHKTFINIEEWFTLPGSMVFYGIISFICVIVLYKIVPETENLTLEEIERHFSNNKLKLTDRKIARLSDKIENTNCKQDTSNEFADKNPTNNAIIQTERF